ncbi:MAG: thermonuclease [Ignavibacteriae bacterium]|nr:MAG: thermonuclease [Ignavibacteriota bacterium]
MNKILLLIILILTYANAQDTITVTKVTDGDTFVTENGDKVRLLGIDTPEKWESSKLDKDANRTNKDKKTIQALGQLSSDYAEKLLLNQKVILYPDSTNDNKDRYGRLLRYAYLLDGTFFNLKIIQDGYAYAYLKFPIIYAEKFREAMKEAAENGRGLWGDINFQELEEK